MSERASAIGAIGSATVGAVSAVIVFSVNESYGTTYFISELFAGLGASLVTMIVLSIKYPSSDSEREVFLKIRTQ